VTVGIAPATDADIPAIRAFNARLAAADAGFELPETPRSLGVAREDGAPVWHEIFVAREGSDVRGGYALKRELMNTRDQQVEIWNLQIPLSEGIVNKAYATLGIRLVQDAAAKHSHLYCLGMGSLQRPLPQLLKRFKWTVEEVPFRFRVLRANGFLRHIEFMRANPKRRIALDVARFTGAGALGVIAWRMRARIAAPAYPADFEASDVSSFGDDADGVFTAHAAKYGAVIDRSAAALNVRFPSYDKRLIRIVIKIAGEIAGWLVLTRSQLKGHKQFGDMRLGCVVDGLCDPQYAGVLIRHAMERLDDEGVHLVVSNQTHSTWLEGLRANGFMGGPSNFILARSPALAAATPAMDQCHINRGDGDGPINL
jgi:hypothetical protein